MLKDANFNSFSAVYIVCGYTDYPRRIIIREVFCEALRNLLIFGIFSNNDSTDIFIVQITIRRYYHNARTEKFIYGTKNRTS